MTAGVRRLSSYGERPIGTADLLLHGDFVPEPGIGAFMAWRARTGELIRGRRHLGAPRMRADPGSRRALEAFYARELAHADQTLVWVRPGRADGCPAILLVAKVRLAERRTCYLGSLVLPFRDFSYHLSVAALARGATRARTHAVLTSLLASGQVRRTWLRGLRGWETPQYGRAGGAAVAAEHEEYDADFPAETLSRLRALLRQVERAVRLSKDTRSAPPFEFVPPWPQRRARGARRAIARFGARLGLRFGARVSAPGGARRVA